MRWFLRFICVLALGVHGCGGTSGSSSELEGAWEFETLEVEEMTTDCPGEITIIPVVYVCPEGAFTFRGDGTFVAVAEAYDPDPASWAEGTWSTEDDILTMTYLRYGTSPDALEPAEPPDLWVVEWSVTDSTLTLVAQDSPSDPPSTYTLGRR